MMYLYAVVLAMYNEPVGEGEGAGFKPTALHIPR